MSTVCRFSLIIVKEFLHKCQPGVGRLVRMGKLWSTQFVNAPLLQTQCSGMTHFSDVLPHLPNLSLKSAVSDLLLFTQPTVHEKGCCTTHHLLGPTSFLSTLCIALFCDFYHFLKLIICINCHNLRNFYDTQKFFQHLKDKVSMYVLTLGLTL